MLHDALKADRFGSIENISFLLQDALSSTQAHRVSDLSDFCEKHSVVFASSIEATLGLLDYLHFVTKDNHGRFLGVEEPIRKGAVGITIAERLFSRLSEDGSLSEFISPEAIEYDPVEDVVCVRNNFLPLELSGLKNLLISAGFLKPHYLSSNLLMIPKDSMRFFEEIVVPSIKTERFSGVHTKHLSLAALKKIQELNEIYGAEAEEFVVTYERERLSKSALFERVRRISDLQCDAGYDVVSFESAESIHVDRFIEVKSYSAETSFFWSRNEVSVSETKGDNYYLCLVDREKMSRQGYEPTFIRNPYKKIFMNEEWQRDAMSWHFYK